MQGELFVAALQLGLVATRAGDAGLELIGHDRAAHAAQVLERTDVALDPVSDLLGGGGLGEGVVRGAKHGDEQLRVVHLTGGGVDPVRLLAGVVDEQLLAGAVDLAHRQPAVLEPAPVVPAELGVAVAVGMPPTLTPRLAATSRWLRPRAHLWRRISRILRMDSRSVAILAPRWGRMDGWTLHRRYPRKPPPRWGQGGLFTITDLGVHDPDLAVHDAETGVHDADFGVHDPPKRLFMMVRNGRSRWSETRTVGMLLGG